MEDVLKEIMGDNFKPDMTKEDISNFFESSVISSGKVVPLEKFTNIEKEYKNSKSEIGKLNKQIEAFNNSKLSEEELKAKNEADNKNLIESLQKQLIQTKVEKIFESNGINADDYKEFIENIVSLDEEKSLKSANSLVSTFKKKIDEGVKNQLEEKLKKSGSLPGGASSSDNSENNIQNYVNEIIAPVTHDNRSIKAKEFYNK